MFFVYIVRCADGTLYTGAARDPHARMDVHNSGKGAKYTRGRRPVSLVYCEPCESLSAALKRERQLKPFSRARKEALIASKALTGGRRSAKRVSMTTWIALFRGLNVAGSHRLPMADLKAMVEQNGCSDVQTYIQSGNVVFRSRQSDGARLAKELSAAVSRSHGFESRVVLLTRGELEHVMADNPFKQGSLNARSLHVFFLAERPKAPNLDSLAAVKAPTEDFALKDRVVYLSAPDGFGRSKMAQRVERLLGVEATARNWRTVTTLVEMADALS